MLLRAKKVILFTIALLAATNLWALPANALQLSPNWLTDTTGQITPATKTKVNEISQKYQRENSLGLYTAVTNGTENGLDPHRYIQQLFAENQLTSKDALILLDIVDRKVEIFSGEQSKIYDFNVRGAIADAKPFLRDGDWNNSVVELVTAIANAPSENSLTLVILLVAFVALCFVLSIIFPSSGGSGDSSYYGGGYDSGGSNGGGSGGDSF